MPLSPDLNRIQRSAESRLEWVAEAAEVDLHAATAQEAVRHAVIVLMAIVHHAVIVLMVIVHHAVIVPLTTNPAPTVQVVIAQEPTVQLATALLATNRAAIVQEVIAQLGIVLTATNLAENAPMVTNLVVIAL